MANKSYINFQNNIQKFEKDLEELIPKEKTDQKQPRKNGAPLPPPRNLSSRSTYTASVVNTLVTGDSNDSSSNSRLDEFSKIKQRNGKGISKVSFPFSEKIPSVLSKKSELTDLLMKLLMKRIFVFHSNSNSSQTSVQIQNQIPSSQEEKIKKHNANEDAVKLMQYLVLIIFAEDHQASSIDGYPSALRVHFNQNRVDEPSQGEATSDDNFPMFHYETKKFPGPNCHFDKNPATTSLIDEGITLGATTIPPTPPAPSPCLRGFNKPTPTTNSDSDEDEDNLENSPTQMAQKLIFDQPHATIINLDRKDNEPKEFTKYSNDYMALPEGTTMKQLKSSALQALYGLVMASQVDATIRQRDLQIVRLLAKIHQYYNGMASKLIHAIQEGIPLFRLILQMNEKSPFDENSSADNSYNDENSNQSPLAELAALVRLSFQPEVRQVISDLGGVYALINLLRWEHALWTEFNHQAESNPVLIEETHQYLQQSIVLRRYICMALTNLTFGSAENKAIVCRRRLCLEALVAQLEVENEDLKQVAASVLRNLSWKTTQMIRQALRKTHASRRLMRAVLIAQRDSTIKNMLSALWNLSSHSNSNKKSICSVDGFLEFFLRTIQRQFEILKCSNDSSLLLVIESCAGIMRNLSSIIANNEHYRGNFTELNGYAIMIDQLSSHSSLTVLVNMINFLHALTQINAWPHMDAKEMKQLISCRALQVLKEISINSHHKALVQTAEAVCHNLIAWSPNVISTEVKIQDANNSRLIIEDSKSQHLSSAEVVYRRRMNNRSRNPRIGYLSVVFETDSDYYHSSTDDEDCEDGDEDNDGDVMGTSMDEEAVTPVDDDDEDEEDSGIHRESGKQNEMILPRISVLEEKIKVYATEGSPCSNGSLIGSSLNSDEENSDSKNSDGWQANESPPLPEASAENVKPSDSALQSPLVLSRGGGAASSLNSSILDIDNLASIDSTIQSVPSTFPTACSSTQLSYSVSRPAELNDDYDGGVVNDEFHVSALQEALNSGVLLTEQNETNYETTDSRTNDEKLLSLVIDSVMPKTTVIKDNEKLDTYHMNQESDSTNSSNSECEFSAGRPRIAVAPIPQLKDKSVCIDSYSSDESCTKASQDLTKKSSQASNGGSKDLLDECIQLAMPQPASSMDPSKESFLGHGLKVLKPPDTATTTVDTTRLSSHNNEESRNLSPPRRQAQPPIMIISSAAQVTNTKMMISTVQGEERSTASLRHPMTKTNGYSDKRPNASFTRSEKDYLLERIKTGSLKDEDDNDTEDKFEKYNEDVPLPPPPTRPISVIDYEEVEKEIEQQMVADEEKNVVAATLKKGQSPTDVKIRKKLAHENSLPLPPSPNEFELAILEQYRLSQTSLNSQLLTSTSSNATNTVYDNAPNPFSSQASSVGGGGPALEDSETEKKSTPPLLDTKTTNDPVEQMISPRSRKLTTKLPEPSRTSSLKSPNNNKKISQIPTKTSGLPEPKGLRIPSRRPSIESTSSVSSPNSRSSSLIQKKTQTLTPVSSKLPAASKISTALPIKSSITTNNPKTSSSEKNQKLAQSLPTSPKSASYGRKPLERTISIPKVVSKPTIPPKSGTKLGLLPAGTLAAKSKIPNGGSLVKKPGEGQAKITRPITPSKFTNTNKTEANSIQQSCGNLSKNRASLTTPASVLSSIKTPSSALKKPAEVKLSAVESTAVTPRKLQNSSTGLRKPSVTTTGLKLPSAASKIPSTPSSSSGTNKGQVLWLSRQELSQS